MSWLSISLLLAKSRPHHTEQWLPNIINNTFIQIDINLKNVGPLFFEFTLMQPVFKHFLFHCSSSNLLYPFGISFVSFEFFTVLSRYCDIYIFGNSIISWQELKLPNIDWPSPFKQRVSKEKKTSRFCILELFYHFQRK